MHKLFWVCFSLLLSTLLSAQRTEVILSFPPEHPHHIRVDIITGHLGYDRVSFRFPEHVPGAFRPLQLGLLCKEFAALDSQNNQLATEFKTVNVIEIKNARALHKITYLMHDSWTFKDSSLIRPQLGTHFDTQNHILINPAAIIGYIDGFQTSPVQLKIFRPKTMVLHAALQPIDKYTSTDSDVFALSSYYELIDLPIVYHQAQSIPFSIGGTLFKLSVYSETGKVKASDIMPILRPVVEGVWAFCHEFTTKEYSFLFHYINPETNRQRSDEVYGAAQHSNSSVFYLPETADKSKFIREIQYTSAHELFHLFKPLNLKTDATNTLNLKAVLPTAHLWLFEGVTEYLSLLMLYRQDLITKNEFITEIRNKISLMTYEEPFNLTTISEQMHLEENESKLSNFYNKGAVMAFMMDLELLKLSDGKMSLLGLLLRLNKNTKDRYVIADKMVIPELVRLSFPQMENFFRQHIQSDAAIDYNEYLSTIGLVYENNRLDTQFLFANAQYRYNKQTDEIFMTQITLNNVGFREGDVLVKINNRKVTKENIDILLETIEDVSYQKPVTFTIKRNGQEQKLTGDPMLINKIQKHVIKSAKEVKPKKVKYSKSFKSGNYRLEKMK